MQLILRHSPVFQCIGTHKSPSCSRLFSYKFFYCILCYLYRKMKLKISKLCRTCHKEYYTLISVSLNYWTLNEYFNSLHINWWMEFIDWNLHFLTGIQQALVFALLTIHYQAQQYYPCYKNIEFVSNIKGM